jgi:hypothetical protein
VLGKDLSFGDDYGGGQNLACWAGLREADAIRLPARAMDNPFAGRVCPRSRTTRRPSELGEAGPGNGVEAGPGNGVQDSRQRMRSSRT